MLITLFLCQLVSTEQASNDDKKERTKVSRVKFFTTVIVVIFWVHSSFMIFLLSLPRLATVTSVLGGVVLYLEGILLIR